MIREFFREEIPASAGWRQVFGSVALFLFAVQAFTGFLLAINYAPTPPEAWHSLRYILLEVEGGPLIRNLHHWGAGMMIAVVGLHLVQTFLWGAYKAPRQATWLAGVGLLVLTLAYGLTGYLLPWDNRAYWGTVVVTRIAEQAPFMARLLASEGGVGAATFARFYAVHTILLPPLTVLLMVVHIYLVRKHGATPVPGDELRPKQRFYPGQAFRDTTAIFVCFAVLFILAVAARAPLARLADPTDHQYVPRPEWYFLFLFQLLKLLQGPLEVAASLLLPVLAIGALVLVPYVDRGRMLRVTRRFTALATVALGGLIWTALTVTAVATTPAEKNPVDYSLPTAWLTLAPEKVAAHPQAPEFAVEGARLYVARRCGACHQVNGTGGKVGPALNGLAGRRTQSWVEEHFRSPQALSPGTVMPPYRFSEKEMDSMIAYLFALP